MRMSADEKCEFPHWEEWYQEREIESMPWFNPELDDDLKQALDELGIRSGSALDLGTGPGTQAMHLVRRGFDVTATDISGAAIRVARGKAEEQGLDIMWEEDDILDTRLPRQFDLIFDRGCFHVLPPERSQEYVSIVGGLLKMGGHLLWWRSRVRWPRATQRYGRHCTGSSRQEVWGSIISSRWPYGTALQRLLPQGRRCMQRM